MTLLRRTGVSAEGRVCAAGYDPRSVREAWIALGLRLTLAIALCGMLMQTGCASGGGGGSSGGGDAGPTEEESPGLPLPLSCSEPTPTTAGANALPQRHLLPTPSVPRFIREGERPAQVDLATSVPTPCNQGEINACVGWVTGYGLMTFLAAENVEDWTDIDRTDRHFSPTFIFNQRNAFRLGRSRFDTCTKAGTFLPDAFELLRDTGCVTWATVPYSVDDCETQPDRETLQSAARFKIKYFRAVEHDVRTLQSYLRQGIPVVAVLSIGERFGQLTAGDIYDTPEQSSGLSHAVLVVGYDDDLEAIKIMNSWGTLWGDGGFGFIGYDLWESIVEEAYVVGRELRFRPAASSGAAKGIDPRAQDVEPEDCLQNPLNDTDGDGYPDTLEIEFAEFGLDPNVPDENPDYNPPADSDGDRWPDETELTLGTNPFDMADYPFGCDFEYPEDYFDDFIAGIESAPRGTAGFALRFDGVDDLVDFGDVLDMGESDFTIEAWIKGDPEMEAWGRIIDKGFATAYALGKWNTGNNIAFEHLGSGSQGNNFRTSSALIDNNWHHIAVVKSGDTTTIYADGEPENVQTVSPAAQDNDLPLLLGFNPGEGVMGHWKGEIDELRIWSVARTETQIRDSLFHLVGVGAEGLLAYWRFDDGEGTTLTDLAGGGFHGALGGGVDEQQPEWVSSAAPIGLAPTTGRNLLINGSFEAGPANVGSFLPTNPGDALIPGWTVTRAEIDFIGVFFAPSHGARSIDLEGTGSNGGIAQAFPTNPGESYHVRFDMAGNPGGEEPIKRMRVEAAGVMQDYEFDTTGRTTVSMGWQTRTFEFTAVDNRTLLEFYSLMENPTDFGPALDNVVVVPAAELAGYDSVDLSAIRNMERAVLIGGTSYPTGLRFLDGLPFELGDEASYFWNADLVEGENPRIVEIPVNVAGVREVHTLINTFWGSPGPESLTAIEFVGSDDALHRVDLVSGDHIRDYNNSTFPNAINGTTTIEVFNNGVGQRIDKQQFDLPEEFAGQTLETIRIIDNGATGVHRAILFGVTVYAP